MSDFSKSKKNNASSYPIKAIDAASFTRVEPLLTPDQFISRFMWGIPLVSPITKQPLTGEQIKDFIQMAANSFEMDAQMDLFPVQRKHRLPFQRDQYQEFIYTEIPNKPILSVDALQIVTSDDQVVYTVPPEWIDTANFIDGKINVVPLSPMIGGTSAFSPSAGGGFLVLIGLSDWLPAYWQVTATSGFNLKAGVPVIVNRMVGLKAAIMLFSTLIPQYQYSSYSLGIDAVSQSQTTQAPQLFAQVRQAYIEEYEDLIQKLKIKFNNGIILGFV
jgi:hypothetical protein